MATWQKGDNMSTNQVTNYEELTIQDYFMFGKICSEARNRKLILDSLLQMDLKESTGGVEVQIKKYRDTKFTRLDLLVKDEEKKVYNAEMQNKSTNNRRQEELPRRSRYYQAMLDTSCLKPKESYLELPEIYIVFICTFDPFGYNLPIYSFKSKCQEKENIVYNDGVHRIFFNTTADLSDLPLDMRNMLEYINSGIVNDEATKEIDSAVKEARLNAEWKEEYMRTLTYQNEVYSEGKEEGSFNATLKNINSVMKSLNKPFDEVCVIMNVQDKETYRKYIDSDTSKSAKAQDN